MQGLQAHIALTRVRWTGLASIGASMLSQSEPAVLKQPHVQEYLLRGLVRLTWRNSPTIFAESRLTKQETPPPAGFN
jgi:hypothetical protein